MAIAIHVYDPHADALADLVRRLAPERRVVALATPAQLAAALPDLEVLFAPDPPRDGWAAARSLRLVQLLGAGVDQLLPSPDLPSAVEVAGVRGAFAVEVAEYVVAMMLSHVRQLPQLLDAHRAHHYAPVEIPTLAGMRLTIVGLGEVGRRLAALAVALGMVVRGVSRSGRPCDGIEVVRADHLGDAIADARFVAIALPLTPATRHLFDAALLAGLRPDAYLINVARGGLVDPDALIAALEARQLAGAALDVVDPEPLPPEHRLWSAPNLLVTPHVAGLGERYVERCAAVLLDNVHRLETGIPRRGIIDRAAGY